MTKVAVSHGSELMVVHIKCDGTPLSYHSNQIRLVQPLVDRRARAARQDWVVRAIRHIEEVTPILTDIEDVVLVRIRVLGAEEDAAIITLDNLHLHFKGEVAEISRIGQT